MLPFSGWLRRHSNYHRYWRPAWSFLSDALDLSQNSSIAATEPTVVSCSFSKAIRNTAFHSTRGYGCRSDSTMPAARASSPSQPTGGPPPGGGPLLTSSTSTAHQRCYACKATEPYSEFQSKERAEAADSQRCVRIVALNELRQPTPSAKPRRLSLSLRPFVQFPPTDIIGCIVCL